MQSVSIKFADGKLTVKNEKGRAIQTNRATVYLVTGNDKPVALLALDGTQAEFLVSSLDVPSAEPMVADEEIAAEGEPKKKGGRE